MVFVANFREPKYFITLGTLTLIAGVTEAILSFWKEVAARVHQPGQPRYYDTPHAAHRGWYSLKSCPSKHKRTQGGRRGTFWLMKKKVWKVVG